MSDFKAGDRVTVCPDIHGVIEELIYCRGMTEPVALVEWWKDGDMVARRLHCSDLRKVEG